MPDRSRPKEFLMTRPPLDPEIADFVKSMQRAWASHPPFTTLSPPDARAIAEKVREPWRQGGPVMAKTGEYSVPTPAGALRIRVYDPGLPHPAPALIYLHGGGFVLFSVDTHDRLMREYAAAGECLVIGVDYPLSPEARYPVALRQIVGLVQWLNADGAAQIGVDPKRIAIGGDSAGANLATATALRLRDEGKPDEIRALLLNYGAYGAVCSDESQACFGGPGAVLDRAEMDYYFESYVGEIGHAIEDPYARPIIADLQGLPPALLVTAECDILAEQGQAMTERLQAAGVEATNNIYPGATHSFLEAMSVAAVARRAIADGAAFVKAKLRV
jgi:acetyl esterase